MATLSRDYGVRAVCGMMGVSRAGYYKWKRRGPSGRDIDREKMIDTVMEIHQKYRTHGYRWVAAYIRNNMHISVSDNYIYKCFRCLGIQAETQHRRHYRPRKVRDRCPNLIYDTWDTVDRPRQVIVSDMTAFKTRFNYFEATFYFDVFTKEILSWRVAERRGAREQYVDALIDVVGLLSGCTEPTIIHTDQGSVFSSKAYNDLIKDTNIVRSMSRAGKPTDNPVNESLNGWIKEEIMSDFRLMEKMYISVDRMREIIAEYVKFYNEKRPCYAIGYDIPVNYRKRYYKGELARKNTFDSRVLSPEPKFVKKRRERTNNERVSQ